MIRLLIAVLISLVLFSKAGRGDDGRAYVPVIYPQVVQLQFDGSTCSGTVVDTNLVLTAAHCVTDKADTITKIQFIDGRLEIAKPVLVGKVNGYMDAAFFSVNTKDIEPLEISRELPFEDEPLYYVSMRDTQQKVIPIVAKEYKNENGGIVLVYRGYTLGGDSGSAILNYEGKVVAVVFARYLYEPLGAASLPLYFDKLTLRK